MTAADRPAFAQLLALLGETFREPISEARVAGYWLACEDVPLPALQAAVREALRTCKFFPRPAELRERAGYVPVGPAWVNHALSEAISGKPVPDFVRLFVARLGGLRGCEDRLPLARLALVEKMYPEIVAAARARGVEIPTEVEARPPLALPAPAARPRVEQGARALDCDQDDEHTA
jgi:hypothetical protein